MVDAKASKAFVLVEHESSSLSPCIFYIYIYVYILTNYTTILNNK